MKTTLYPHEMFEYNRFVHVPDREKQQGMLMSDRIHSIGYNYQLD